MSQWAANRLITAPQQGVCFDLQQDVEHRFQRSSLAPKAAVQQMQQNWCLLDHLVGRREQRRWDGEAENPRRLVVDYQLEL